MGLFSIFKTSKKEEKMGYLRVIVEMAGIDGRISDKEDYMINLFAKILKLSEKEIRESKSLDYNQVTLPTSSKDKEQLITDLIMLMLIDNDISESEYLFCKDVASRLSISGVFVDNKINEIISNAHLLLNGAYDQKKLQLSFTKILMNSISKTMKKS